MAKYQLEFYSGFSPRIVFDQKVGELIMYVNVAVYLRQGSLAMLASYKCTVVNYCCNSLTKSLNSCIYAQGVVANMFAEEEWTDNMPINEQAHSAAKTELLVGKVDF